MNLRRRNSKKEPPKGGTTQETQNIQSPGRNSSTQCVNTWQFGVKPGTRITRHACSPPRSAGRAGTQPNESGCRSHSAKPAVSLHAASEGQGWFHVKTLQTSHRGKLSSLGPRRDQSFNCERDCSKLTTRVMSNGRG